MTHLWYLGAAIGLAAAAGLNTSLALLMLGLAVNLEVVGVPAPYAALGAGWLPVLGGLALVEFGADKIPFLDLKLHMAQMPAALLAGGVLAGSQADGIATGRAALVWTLGATLAGGLHLARATLRPAVRLVPLGLSGAGLSLLEDVTAGVLGLLALALPPLAPLVVVALIVIWAVTLYVVFRMAREVARQGLAVAGDLAAAVVDRVRGPVTTLPAWPLLPTAGPIEGVLPQPAPANGATQPEEDIWDV